MKHLRLSTTDKKIWGVCGGLGEYFGIDPLWFRIIFLLLIAGRGVGPGIYFIAYFIMAANTKR